MITCAKVDFNDPKQGKLVVDLLEAYATDAMGGGESLQETTKRNLASGMIILYLIPWLYQNLSWTLIMFDLFLFIIQSWLNDRLLMFSLDIWMDNRRVLPYASKHFPHLLVNLCLIYMTLQ